MNWIAYIVMNGVSAPYIPTKQWCGNARKMLTVRVMWRNEHGYYPILRSYNLGNLAVEVCQWIRSFTRV